MKGSIPIVMCEDDLGCDEWIIDNYEMGVSNWRDLIPTGWRYNPHDTMPDLCPEHAGGVQ